jgi:LEA14-like dessication related protein
MRPFLISLAIPALCGCSLFVPKLETPALSIVNVQLLKGSDLWHQELKVRLRVQNPNDRSLPIKGLTYELDLDDQDFAHGESGASFVVPALGEAEFDMSVHANLTSLAIKLLGQGASQVQYHIRGNIALSSGLLRHLKFDDQGTFKLQ